MKNIFAILIVVLGIAAGCSKNQLAPVPKKGSQIGDSLKIRMTENVDSVSRKLTLTCFTAKVYECSNYYIANTFSIVENKISIYFIEIQKPTICLTSPWYASAVIDLGSISNKKYTLELNFGSIKVEGQLDVSADSYKATIPVQRNVQFVNPVLNRIPDNTIWGTVHYHFSSTGTLVQKFIDSLQIAGAVPTTYLPGNYLNFQIEGNGQIKQTQDLGYYFTRYYIFNYANSSASLKKLVRNFGTTYPDSLLITLNTTKGETFYSWRP